MASTKNLAHLSAPEILEMGQQVTRLRIPSDRPFDYQTYLLEKPHRLVIDTQGTVLAERENVREIRASSNLERIRTEAGNRAQNTDLRFILDLRGEVTFQHSYHNNYVEIL